MGKYLKILVRHLQSALRSGTNATASLSISCALSQHSALGMGDAFNKNDSHGISSGTMSLHWTTHLIGLVNNANTTRKLINHAEEKEAIFQIKSY